MSPNVSIPLNLTHGRNPGRNLRITENMNDHNSPFSIMGKDLFYSIDEHNLDNCSQGDYLGHIASCYDFRTLYLNMQSLPNHYLKLEVLVGRLEYSDFIIITETWLNEADAIHFGLNSYNHFYRVRKEKMGGWVSTFSHEKYDVDIIEDYEHVLQDSAEALFFLWNFHWILIVKQS